MSEKSLQASKLNDWASLYAQNMSYDNDNKVWFFSSAIEEILSKRQSREPLSILDIWCNNGDLILRLDDYFGSRIQTHGVDIGAELVKMAPEWKASVGNWYDLNWFESSSRDVLLYSSFLHELWSYHVSENYPEYSKESYYEGIRTWLTAAQRVLRIWGHLLIKDPVRPLSPSEMLTLRLREWVDRIVTASQLAQYGALNAPHDIDIWNLNINDLSVLDSVPIPNSLPYLPRMALFLRWFRWSHSQIPNWIISMDWSKAIQLSRDLVADISRHMPWWYSKQSFTDEQKEWYWSLNSEEWDIVLKDTWFIVESHEVTYRKSDHSKLMADTFQVFDPNWKEIHTYDISPTHHYTILRRIK